MFHQKQGHLTDYLTLLLILTTAAVAVRVFSMAKSSLLLTSFTLSLVYVVWGITHHKKAGHIDRKIMLEYSGLAILVNIIILSLIV